MNLEWPQQEPNAEKHNCSVYKSSPFIQDQFQSHLNGQLATRNTLFIKLNNYLEPDKNKNKFG